ncbi:Ribonucleoside-diphosphate reductase beta subunit [Lactiplantibacillus plantarum 4_3]|uniref:ribonucleotide-diphosphate reductase subunit beta n=1 Tax=Lactiplantibacillus plantarum TaxID=1590 RepID=UPI0003D3D19E|nr:ribonucleotide-diphosphate reductase subunit beta [Lactiplantibacillus plantarum]ETF12658.1 Ribonucleoside-diphosphate reductase beta subunit [Lactiplantibacillus plantarum 4_3]
MTFLYYKAINWDETEDEFDQQSWEKLTNNFWLDNRVPVAEDLKYWAKLSPTYQQLIGRALASVSMITDYQSEYGAPALREGRRTQQEEAVLNITTFMESVHTKSVTTIFRALQQNQQSSAYFSWADNNIVLQQILDLLDQQMQDSSIAKRQAVFILMETVLLFVSIQPVVEVEQLSNVRNMISNILSGSAIFTSYLGYKFRKNIADLSQTQHDQLVVTILKLEASLQKMVDEFTAQLYTQVSEQPNEIWQFSCGYANQLLGITQESLPDISSPTITMIKKISLRSKQASSSNEILDNDATEAMQESDYDF